MRLRRPPSWSRRVPSWSRRVPFRSRCVPFRSRWGPFRSPWGPFRSRRGPFWSRPRRDDRGSSVVELAVLAPAFLMIIMLIVQFGLWFNARQAALAAAQAGAQIARENAAVTANWPALAEQASTSYYDTLNTSLLSSLRATAHGDRANQVFVTVSGPMGYSVFNFFGIKWTITETAGGPVECFRPAGAAGACG